MTSCNASAKAAGDNHTGKRVLAYIMAARDWGKDIELHQTHSIPSGAAAFAFATASMKFTTLHSMLLIPYFSARRCLPSTSSGPASLPDPFQFPLTTLMPPPLKILLKYRLRFTMR